MAERFIDKLQSIDSNVKINGYAVRSKGQVSRFNL